MFQNLDNLFSNNNATGTEKNDFLATNTMVPLPATTSTAEHVHTVLPPPTPASFLHSAVEELFSTSSDSKVNSCSQSTQVDEFELENFEMRTILPFRSKGYQSIRSNYPTTFGQNVYGVNGIMPPSATETKNYFQSVLNTNEQFSSAANTPATSAVTDKIFQLKEDSHMMRSRNYWKSKFEKRKPQ